MHPSTCRRCPGVFLLEYAERFVTDLHDTHPRGQVALEQYLDKTRFGKWFENAHLGMDKRAKIKS